jgi:hypothetical protein
MSNTLKVMALVLLAIAMDGVRAADTREGGATAATAADNQADMGAFNINRWAEGTIQSIDAKNNKFTIRGHQRAWASEYAKMMKDIHDKTMKLDPAQRQAKADEIRKSYADNLAKARTETEKDSDYTFYLPKESNGRFMLFELQGNQGDKFSSTPHNFSDLKVGEQFIIGYDAGTLYNYAHNLVRGAASDAQLKNFMDSQMPDFATKAAQ